MRYILYCAQEANFQTRSMLIPYDLIIKSKFRVADLETLRAHAQKNVTIKHRDREYLIDQLIVQDYKWEGNCGSQQIQPFTTIVNHFTGYADGMHEDYDIESEEQKIATFKQGDEVWVSDIIGAVASKGFNHFRNYCNFRNRTEYKGKSIEIVEGFLVLESNDGKMKMPSVDTVAEMHEKYYN
ncbi:Hypothetical protein HVR_LOCUS963 [uncultured virus]|nr:Hypothetical protein HVR_LOCUS963 [uncultured virus]